MHYPFDKKFGLVVVEICLELSGHRVVTKAAIDTGSTFTVIHSDIIHFLGTTPEALRGSVHVATAKGMQDIPRVRLDRISSMGKTVRGFEVLCHDLPPTARVQGLLGVNFLQRFQVVINYKRGFVKLS